MARLSLLYQEYSKVRNNRRRPPAILPSIKTHPGRLLRSHKISQKYTASSIRIPLGRPPTRQGRFLRHPPRQAYQALRPTPFAATPPPVITDPRNLPKIYGQPYTYSFGPPSDQVGGIFTPPPPAILQGVKTHPVRSPAPSGYCVFQSTFQNTSLLWRSYQNSSQETPSLYRGFINNVPFLSTNNVPYPIVHK